MRKKRERKVEKVAEAWNAGKSIEEILSELGLKENTVKHYLKEACLHGITIRKQETRTEQVVRQWNCGKTIEEISAELGLKESTVKQCLKEASLQGNFATRREKKEIRIELVVRQWNLGKTIGEISTELGLKENTIKQYLKEARLLGIEVRKKEKQDTRIEQVVKKWNEGANINIIS